MNRGDNQARDDACGDQVLRLADHRLPVLGVKRQNAPDTADNLIGVAKEIKHRENHDEQIENKLRDVAQNRAEALSQKSRLFLNTLFKHLQHVGIGVQARHALHTRTPWDREPR